MRKVCQTLRFLGLLKAQVIDRDADGGDGDEEGDVVDQIAIVEGLASIWLLGVHDELIEGHEKNYIHGDGDVRSPNKQGAPVHDHGQEANDLLLLRTGDVIAIGDFDAESKAHGGEKDDDNIRNGHAEIAFEENQKGIGQSESRN